MNVYQPSTASQECPILRDSLLQQGIDNRQAYTSRCIIKDKIAKDIFTQRIYLLGLRFVACAFIHARPMTAYDIF